MYIGPLLPNNNLGPVSDKGYFNPLHIKEDAEGAFDVQSTSHVPQMSQRSRRFQYK